VLREECTCVGRTYVDAQGFAVQDADNCVSSYSCGAIPIPSPLWPSSSGEESSWGQLVVLYCALYIIAMGTGGIKPNVSAFGADQFDERDPTASPPLFPTHTHAHVHTHAHTHRRKHTRTQNTQTWGFTQTHGKICTHRHPYARTRAQTLKRHVHTS
jgi:hypothetical protein